MTAYVFKLLWQIKSYLEYVGRAKPNRALTLINRAETNPQMYCHNNHFFLFRQFMEPEFFGKLDLGSRFIGLNSNPIEKKGKLSIEAKWWINNKRGRQTKMQWGKMKNILEILHANKHTESRTVRKRKAAHKKVDRFYFKLYKADKKKLCREIVSEWMTNSVHTGYSIVKITVRSPNAVLGLI